MAFDLHNPRYYDNIGGLFGEFWKKNARTTASNGYRIASELEFDKLASTFAKMDSHQLFHFLNGVGAQLPATYFNWIYAVRLLRLYQHSEHFGAYQSIVRKFVLDPWLIEDMFPKYGIRAQQLGFSRDHLPPMHAERIMVVWKYNLSV